MKSKTAVKAAVKAGPKEITKEIKGQLAFQRTGGGMVVFKTVCPDIFSNPLVQVPIDILPADYAPEKYAVDGTFIYKIVVRKK
jgi:hypothetical protein